MLFVPLLVVTIPLHPAGPAGPAAPPAPVAVRARPAVAAETTVVVLAATTDVHGRVMAWDYERDREAPLGLVRAAAAVDSLRRAHPGRVILVDAGDLIQGNPFATYFARIAPQAEHPILAAMNRMGYDAAVLGNHEFNFGLPVMQRALGAARFPYVAANLERVDGEAVLPPFVILERGTVRVAIVGATTPGTMVWDGPHVRGRLLVRGVRETVPGAVAAARRQGADLVVLVAHAGLDGPSSYPGEAAAAENDVAGAIAASAGLDVAIIGHTHREIADSVVHGVTVAQPRNWAQSVAVVEVTLVRGEGDGERGAGWRVVRRRGARVPLAAVRPDTGLVRLMTPAHDSARAWATRPVARSAAAMPAARARLEDTPVIDLINTVQRERTGADLSATAAFDTRGAIPAGDVSRADIASIYPYDNTLKAVRISGADLRAFLEHASRHYRGIGADGRPVVNDSVPGYNFDIVSGADYELDLTRPVGRRVVRLAVRGRAVADTDSFTLATNNYRAAGGGGFTMIARAPVVYDRGEDIRDVLVEWLARRGTVRPEDVFVRNWSIRGLAAAQTEGR